MLKKISENLKALKSKLDDPRYQKMVCDFRKGILRENLPCSRDQALEFAVIAGNVGFFHTLYDEVYKKFDLDKLIPLVSLAIVQFPESNKLAFSIFERMKKNQTLMLLASADKTYLRIAFVTNNIEFFRYVLKQLSLLSDDKKVLKNNFFRTVSADDICLNIQNGYFEIVDDYLSSQDYEVIIQMLTYKNCNILAAYYEKGQIEKVRNLIFDYGLESKFPSDLLSFYVCINDYVSFEKLGYEQKNLSEIINYNDYSVLKCSFRNNDIRFAQFILPNFSGESKFMLAMQIRFAQEENSIQGRFEIFKFLWKHEPIDFPMMQLCKSSYFKEALKNNNLEIAKFIWDNHCEQKKLENEVGDYDFISSCIVSNARASVKFIFTEVISSKNAKQKIIKQNNYKLFADISPVGWTDIANIMLDIEEKENHKKMVIAFSGFSIRVAAENNHYDLLSLLVSIIPTEERFGVLVNQIKNLFYSLCLQNEKFNSFFILACSIQEFEVRDLSEHILGEEFSSNGVDIADDFQKHFYSESEIKSSRQRILELRNKGFGFSEIFEMQKYKRQALPLVLTSKQMIPSLPSEINNLVAYHLCNASSAGYSEQRFGFIISSMSLSSVKQIPHFSEFSYETRARLEKDAINQLRLLQVMS